MSSTPGQGVSQRGFTLVEAVLSMVILSIAALSIGQTLGFAFVHSSDGLWQARTVALAEAYLEEVLARRYDEAAPPGGVPPCGPPATACSGIGPDAAESRATFDDVDDYHGLLETPPLDANGNARVGFESYSASITERYISAAEVTALGLDDPTDAKHIEVVITPPGRSEQRFSVIRGNY